MKPILSLKLKLMLDDGWSFDGRGVSLCVKEFRRLFSPQLRNAKRLTLKIYRERVSGAAKIYAQHGMYEESDLVLWGKHADSCGNVIASGDEVFLRYLTEKPRPFWLKVTNVQKETKLL